MTRPLIIYHAPCADGFTAAWVIRKRHPDAEFFPAVHQKPLPDVSDRNVLFLDYAPKRDVMLEIVAKARSVQLFDHHEGAQKALGDAQQKLSLCIFDMKRSGAGLTWDLVFPGQPRPWLVDYVEDRDLWNWKLPRSREVASALDTYEQTFEVWDKLAERCPEDVANDGVAFRVYEEAYLKKVIPEAREVEFEGYKILTINSTLLVSELGAALAKGRPFAIVWRRKGDGCYAYSLRSDDAGLDVTVIAQKYGGNGHPRASGFSSPILLF